MVNRIRTKRRLRLRWTGKQVRGAAAIGLLFVSDRISFPPHQSSFTIMVHA
ncbi:MAG TPA: hypothetical protein VK993_10440 [Chthoniobacterales bacterium]|nr:hypothetical protein [Chthoniobacterales bacterium]